MPSCSVQKTQINLIISDQRNIINDLEQLHTQSYTQRSIPPSLMRWPLPGKWGSTRFWKIHYTLIVLSTESRWRLNEITGILSGLRISGWQHCALICFWCAGLSQYNWPNSLQNAGDLQISGPAWSLVQANAQPLTSAASSISLQLIRLECWAGVGWWWGGLRMRDSTSSLASPEL